MNCRTVFVGLLTILSFPSCLRAQTASIAGSITDSTGAAVSNVKITAQNVDTGVAQTAQRDESGVYRMTNLNPGIYDITIEHPSFKAAFKTRVFTCTSQGQSANVDVGTPNAPNNGTNFGAGRLPRDPIRLIRSRVHNHAANPCRLPRPERDDPRRCAASCTS